MSEAAPHAMLECFRIVTAAQHLDVVVGLDEDGGATTQAVSHFIRNVADVSDMAESQIRATQAEANGVGSVVRGWKEVDLQSTKLHARARLYTNPRDVTIGELGHLAIGAGGRIERHRVLGAETPRALRVIGVLV